MTIRYDDGGTGYSQPARRRRRRRRRPRSGYNPGAINNATPNDAGQYTAQSWAHALLQRLGAPATAANVKAIVAWEAAEGGHWNNTAWYNPLNTTEAAPGSHSMNDVGVKAYTSWEQGLNATVATLENGRYQSVLSALRQGDNAGAVANAVVNSPWGTKSISLDGNYNDYGTTTRQPGMQGIYTTGGMGFDAEAGGQLTRADFVQGLDAAGFPKALLESIPELRQIFRRAVQQKWWQTEAGQNRFLTAIKSTKWYRQTTDNQRHMEALRAEDPDEFERELTQKLADTKAMASSLGINLSDREMNAVAHRGLMFGLDDNQVRNLMAAHIQFQEDAKYSGQLGLDVNSLRQLATNYYVNLSDGTMTNLLQNMVRGQMSPDNMTDYFKQLAESKFPHLKQQLDSGQTVADIADPYKQEMSKTLEVDPNGIENEDPTIMKALQQPTENGGFQLMPIWQFQQMLKQDPRWLNTVNAHNSLMDVTSGLLKDWGLMA